jgi:FAD/FMN-containing dehydrogenase
VTASATEHADLFWALKGGGGNFGVVTRFDFQAYDFGPLMRIGVALYKPADAVEALRGYAAIYPTLGRNVGWHAALKHDMPVLPFVPPELVGERLLMLISMWLDDADDPAGVELIERLGQVGNPCVTPARCPFGRGPATSSTRSSPTATATTPGACVAARRQAIDLLLDFWKHALQE